METAERPSLGSLPAVRRLFDRAVERLLAQVPADRCVLLFGEDSAQDLKPRASRGLPLEDFWLTAPLSLSLLREVREEGVPRLLLDVPREGSVSLLLADIGSVICVPFWGPSGNIDGLLYADSAKSRLNREHLDKALRLALELTRDLEEVVRGPRTNKPPRRRTGSSTRRKALGPGAALVPRKHPAPRDPARPLPGVKPPARAPLPPPRAGYSQPSLRHALMVFYRGVATLLGAGIPLTRALQLMALQGEHGGLRQALEDCLRQLDGGQRLSVAMAAHPRVFASIQVALVQVGEETGSLHQVLDRLALYQEKSASLHAKLVGALAYPAFVCVACLVMLVVVPAFTFGGLFSFLEGLQVPIPWPTQLLMLFLKAIRSPLGLIPLALLVATPWAARRLYARREVQRLVERIPGLGTALRTAALAQLARTLATLYGAGAPLVKALDLTAEGTHNLLLRDALAIAKAEILGGEPLHRALAHSGYFPPVLVHIVAAGETVGQVAPMLEKAANLADESVDQALLTAVAALQPLVLGSVGLLTGFMVLAMMSPLIKVAQAL